MRNRWISGTVPLVFAAGMVACGGSDDRREEEPVQDRMANAQQQMTLTGCVQTGTLETQYVLQNALTDEQAAQQRSNENQTRDPARPDNPAITPYSFVQLRAENASDLRQYLGQEVRVTGKLTDTGESTIGTSGAKGAQGTHQAPSGDKSMAAATDRSHSEKERAEAGPIARESMANGTAPIIRVENISPTGRNCSEAPTKR